MKFLSLVPQLNPRIMTKLIPPEIIVEGIDDVLYDIGLSLTSTRDVQTPRKLIYHPLVVLSITALVVIQHVIAIFVDQDHRILLNLMGSPGDFFGVKVLTNWFLIQFTLISIFSQIIFYYNYVKGVDNTFIKIFQMMSGKRLPSSIGLKNQQDVFKLINITRKLNWVIKLNNKYNITTLTFVFYFLVYLVNNDILNTLVYGVPNSILMTIWDHHCMNIFGYQFLYFNIICVYIKIRIKEKNAILLEMTKGKQFIRIQNIPKTFDALYREINDYNVTYWSKFLFNIWFNYGTVIIILIIIVVKLPSLHLKLMILYPVLIHSIIFLFIILTAASVNSEANKTYKILNSLLSLIFIQKINITCTKMKNIMKVIIIRKSLRLVIIFYSS